MSILMTEFLLDRLNCMFRSERRKEIHRRSTTDFTYGTSCDLTMSQSCSTDSQSGSSRSGLVALSNNLSNTLVFDTVNKLILNLEKKQIIHITLVRRFIRIVFDLDQDFFHLEMPMKNNNVQTIVLIIPSHRDHHQSIQFVVFLVHRDNFDRIHSMSFLPSM